LIRAFFALGLGVSLLGLSPWPWWFELFGHARPTYIGLLLLLLPLVRERVALGLWLAALLLNLGLVAPLYFGGARAPGTGKFLLCNVWSSNPDYTRVRELLEREQADVVVLLEVRPRLLEDLKAVLVPYAGQLLLPRPDNFGMALLSRRPLHNGQVLGGSMPYMVADTEVAGKPLHLVAAHPMPPLDGDYSARRSAQIVELATHLSGSSGPFVLLGDLNDTPWAPSLGPLRSVAVSARAGFGCQCSWPTMLPFCLRIPIDQCFVNQGMAVVDCHLGPEVGSDHFPLLVGVSL
jgi:endonuclease/exonuclease/phosphatase (EEP) superfamily protein YafD